MRPFWYLRRRPAILKSEIDEELKVHLDMRTDELRARGWSEDQARREALRQFGDLERTRAYCEHQDRHKESQVHRRLMVEDVIQDIRISARSLVRSPVMTAVIVATVGLGIGATTTVFAAVDAALLRPLPYANADRLVRIYTDAPPNKFPFSVVDYLALTKEQTLFEQIAGYTSAAATFTDGTVADRIQGRNVSPSYFTLLGVKPELGQAFVESDGAPGNQPVIVSHRFWQTHLGGRADAIGTMIRLDGESHGVAGVLPGIVGPFERNRDFFIAVQWRESKRKGPFFITALGRLRSNADRVAARDELRAIDARLFPIWKSSYQDDAPPGTSWISRHSSFRMPA